MESAETPISIARTALEKRTVGEENTPHASRSVSSRGAEPVPTAQARENQHENVPLVDEFRAGLLHYQANLASGANQVAVVRMETNTQIAVYSQELSAIWASNEELAQMCQWSEGAHARDRNQLMEVAAQHTNVERAVADMRKGRRKGT